MIGPWVNVRSFWVVPCGRSDGHAGHHFVAEEYGDEVFCPGRAFDWTPEKQEAWEAQLYGDAGSAEGWALARPVEEE